MQPRALLAFLGCSLIWGSTWAAIRAGLGDLPPFTFCAARFVLATTVMAGVVHARGRSWRPPAGLLSLTILIGSLQFVVDYLAVFWAETRITSSTTALLFATLPLAVGAASHLLHPEERLTARQAGALLLGVAGVALVLPPEALRIGSRELPAVLAVFLAVGAAACGNVLVRKAPAALTPELLCLWGFGLTAIVSGTAALLFERGRAVWTLRGALLTLYLALLGTVVAFLLFFWLLRQWPASRASLVSVVNPPLAVAFGAALLGEPLSARFLSGAVLVTISVLLNLMSGSRSKEPSS